MLFVVEIKFFFCCVYIFLKNIFFCCWNQVFLLLRLHFFENTYIFVCIAFVFVCWRLDFLCFRLCFSMMVYRFVLLWSSMSAEFNKQHVKFNEGSLFALHSLRKSNETQTTKQQCTYVGKHKFIRTATLMIKNVVWLRLSWCN